MGYQQTVLVAQQEVEGAIVSFLKSQEQSDRLASAVEQVDDANEIVLTLYRTGATDFNRVFSIQAAQFSQQDQLAVAQASQALNLIKIYSALGGGWQYRCGLRSASVTNFANDYYEVEEAPNEDANSSDSQSDENEGKPNQKNRNNDGAES